MQKKALQFKWLVICTEAEWIRTVITPQDKVNPDAWCPIDGGRTKFSLGKVEPGVAQIWTGLIFKTPPGWSLHIRSPINTHPKAYRIMEGILETDWMQYDIWLNIVFDRPGKAEFRRDGWPPIAQIIPVQRQTYSPWSITVQDANRDDPDANQTLEFWMNYNEEKFGRGGQQYLADGVSKDSTTFFRNRKRILDGDGLPKPQELAHKCPFMARQAIPPTGKKIVIYKRKNPGLKRPGHGTGDDHQ
jgi:hypothetical protein